MSTEFVVQCMYAADPFGVIGGEVALAGNNELVAQVLPQTAGISMESVLSPFQNVPLESPLETILAKKSLSLSSHILYGSSRLGTMDYLPGQYISNSNMSITPHFRLDNIRYTDGSWVNEEVLVRVCDDGGDRYRFGFNGMLKDNEWAGMGTHLDFGARIYDSRVGRFMSIDPFMSMYPFYSSYQFAGNKPIWKIDWKGLEEAEPEMSKEQINEKVTALKIQYQKMIWTARSVGANVATANLQNFLEGSGSPRTLSASWLRSHSVVRKGENRIKRYFQDKNIPIWGSDMEVGQTIRRSDYWEAAINSYSSFNELSYASGGSNIRADGDFSLTKTENNIISVSGTVIMNWNDPYDWHDGLGFWIY